MCQVTIGLALEPKWQQKLQYTQKILTDRSYTQVRKINLNNGLKARVRSDQLQLHSTKDGVTLQLLPDYPPGPPDLSLPHQHRHPGNGEAEGIIICKGQEPPQGRLDDLNGLLVMLRGTLALQSSTGACLILTLAQKMQKKGTVL